jgi:hypothetical protein
MLYRQVFLLLVKFFAVYLVGSFNIYDFMLKQKNLGALLAGVVKLDSEVISNI